MSKRVIIPENLLFIGLKSVPGNSIGVIGPTTPVVAHKTDYGLTGALDGINKVFLTSKPFNATTLKLYSNGVRQTITVDYTITGASQVTYVIAPTPTTILIADYDVS